MAVKKLSLFLYPLPMSNYVRLSLKSLGDYVIGFHFKHSAIGLNCKVGDAKLKVNSCSDSISLQMSALTKLRSLHNPLLKCLVTKRLSLISVPPQHLLCDVAECRVYSARARWRVKRTEAHMKQMISACVLYALVYMKLTYKVVLQENPDNVSG